MPLSSNIISISTECEGQRHNGQRLAGVPAGRVILIVKDCIFLGLGYKSKNVSAKILKH